MRSSVLHATYVSLTALVVAACASDDPSADELNESMLGTTPSTSGTQPMGSATPTSDTSVVAPVATPTTPGSVTGEPPSGVPTTEDTVSPMPVNGPGPVDTTVPGPEPTLPVTPEGVGGGGSEPPPPVNQGMGGAGGGGPGPDQGTGATPPIDPEPAAGGAGGMPPVGPEPEVEGPFAPRTGPFKMLAYYNTRAFKHDSIPNGLQMLTELGAQQGFEVTTTAANDWVNLETLADYEILFFMNTTGDIFNNNEQQVFEDWMTNHDGAFGGVHAATDTENGWAFYSEVTGQYYDLHDNCCAEAEIQWDPAALNFIAVQGLPNPWRRAEEWYKFDRATQWSSKTGFTILGRVTTNGNTRPVSYVREWNNFRSFYTSLGHQGSTFADANVRKHIAAGIMWAVRREAELVQ